MSDVVVLAYHAVSEDWPAGLAITPELLERQLSSLVSRGYQGATFTDAVHQPPSPRTLAVTFDDAYRSVIELARPILRELAIPGTVFVPTAFAGSERPMSWPGISSWVSGPHGTELIPMSWDELGRLAEDGWQIGSHTRSHPRLPALDSAALREELAGSRADCEQRLGLPCRALAYPYGDCSRPVADAAREAGYTAACAVSRRFERGDPMLWPRVGIYRDDELGRFRLKVSPLARRIRLGAVWASRRLPSRLHGSGLRGGPRSSP